MRKLLAFIAVALGLAGGLPATSSAGGWVVVSLDSLPAVHAGEDTEVGFTVLRHGVTPEQSDDLVIVARGPGGEHRFEATQQGAAGHYVATVRLPDAGAYRWEVTGEFVACRSRHARGDRRARRREPVDVGRRAVGQRNTRRGDGGARRSSTSAGRAGNEQRRPPRLDAARRALRDRSRRRGRPVVRRCRSASGRWR